MKSLIITILITLAVTNALLGHWLIASSLGGTAVGAAILYRQGH